MSAATHKKITYTVHTEKKLMWQVGDVLIEAGYLIQAGGSRAFVLIEAGACIRSFTVFSTEWKFICCLHDLGHSRSTIGK